MSSCCVLWELVSHAFSRRDPNAAVGYCTSPLPRRKSSARHHGGTRRLSTERAHYSISPLQSARAKSFLGGQADFQIGRANVPPVPVHVIFPRRRGSECRLSPGRNRARPAPQTSSATVSRSFHCAFKPSRVYAQSACEVRERPSCSERTPEHRTSVQAGLTPLGFPDNDSSSKGATASHFLERQCKRVWHISVYFD